MRGLDSITNSKYMTLSKLQEMVDTGVGCHFLLQGIFPTQGLNPHLYYRQILYHLSHQGSPNCKKEPSEMLEIKNKTNKQKKHFLGDEKFLQQARE